MNKISFLPIFDSVEYLSFEPDFPNYLVEHKDYADDYRFAHEFLYAYRDTKPTYNAYRREVERLLHWAWQVAHQSIIKLSRADLENYIRFCQKPPKRWIGMSKPARFKTIDGKRKPNPDWRPFVVTVTKASIDQELSKDNYQLSEKAIREIFAVLSSFYNFLIQESHTDVNPIARIKQKSRFIKRYQTSQKVRRLTDMQWSFVIETARTLADEEQVKHERTLFIMSALYSMYLRISELVVSDRWSPTMNDFKRDQDGNWWFTTVSKGNKERQIAVSNDMLEALKRWRGHLGLSALPLSDDQTPLVPKSRGNGGITSTNQIRNIVQFCFDQAVEKMIAEGFADEVGDLRVATVHWLRHTGISDDVKRRPREHVRDDAGHSSSQITDKYIDVNLRDRHGSAKKKPMAED